MTKDWFDKHVVVMTLDDDKKKEKAIKAALKKTVIKFNPLCGYIRVNEKAALKKEIKKDAGKFLKSKDGKNYLKLKKKEVA